MLNKDDDVNDDDNEMFSWLSTRTYVCEYDALIKVLGSLLKCLPSLTWTW